MFKVVLFLVLSTWAVPPSQGLPFKDGNMVRGAPSSESRGVAGQRRLLGFPLQGKTVCTRGGPGVSRKAAAKVCRESKASLVGLIDASLKGDGTLLAQYYGPNLVVYGPGFQPILGNSGPAFDFFVQVQLPSVCQCVTKAEGTSEIIAYKNRAILRNFFKLEYINGTLLATGHEIMTMVKASTKNKVTKWVVEWEAFTFNPLLQEEDPPKA